MELLNDDYKAPYQPKQRKYIPKYFDEQRTELENFDREVVTEDFSDSPFADKNKEF